MSSLSFTETQLKEVHIWDGLRKQQIHQISLSRTGGIVLLSWRPYKYSQTVVWLTACCCQSVSTQCIYCEKEFLALDAFTFIAGNESKYYIRRLNFRPYTDLVPNICSWQNFLGLWTDYAITKSKKKYIVGIFFDPDPIPVCAGKISIGLESGYGQSFQKNLNILGRASGFVVTVYQSAKRLLIPGRYSQSRSPGEMFTPE